MKRILSRLVPFAAVLAFAVPAQAGGEQDKEKEKDKLTLEQVPEKVRETIQREVKDGKILEIGREKEKGQETFEVEYKTPEGKEFELEIGPDGTLLSKEED